MSGRWEGLTEFRPAPDAVLLDRYVAELLKWNKAVRLIGPQDEEGAALQIIDSLLPFMYAPPLFPLLDIGSGAGLPAIPLATLNPESPITCLEPLSKRVSFIRHAARTLGLKNITVVCGRAGEDNQDGQPPEGGFACVTARAVTDVETLLRWSSPYLAPGGRVILGRGGDPVSPPAGWTLLRHVHYAGPAGMGPRSVAVFSRP